MKYQYKYETHCHTKEASLCSNSSAKELVKAYYNAGYTGIVITDHFFNGNTALHQDLSWDDRVNQFCLGYENALKATNEYDIDVFFGFEYNHFGTEFLIYGLNKEFLLSNPDMINWSLDYFFNKVRNAGGFINHAHPFREAPYIKKIRLYPDKVDSVEVLNSRNLPIFNERALKYAEDNNLPKLSGSDTHDAGILNGGGTYFKDRLYSNECFIKKLKCGEFSI